LISLFVAGLRFLVFSAFFWGFAVGAIFFYSPLIRPIQEATSQPLISNFAPIKA